MTPFYYNTFLNKFKLPCHKTCHSRECGGYPLGHPECKSDFYISNLTPSILFGQPHEYWSEFSEISSLK